MTIDRFKRVLWRLREIKQANNTYNHKQIRIAIMQEIGTDERTITASIKTMVELGMLKRTDELGIMYAETNIE